MIETQNCPDSWEIERQKRSEAEARRLAFLRERRRLESRVALGFALLLCVVGWLLYTLVMFVWRLIDR